MINNILANRGYTNNIDFYQQKNIYNDKQKTKESSNFKDSFELSDSAISEAFDTYFMKFMGAIKAGINTEEKIESLSYKYKEFYDEIINNNNLSDNNKNEKIQGLNHMFKCVLTSSVSNDAFIAKSNQIHDRLVADLNKDIIVNPDKEKHHNILKNDKIVTEYLNNLDKILTYNANIYYESFINDIKTNSVKDSVKNAFAKMEDEYYNAKDKAEELSKVKTELYKYIDSDTIAFSKNSNETSIKKTDKKLSQFMPFSSAKVNKNMSSVFGLDSNIYIKNRNGRKQLYR